nr:hypothetical protein [Tanacetum cinerariifolium]
MVHKNVTCDNLIDLFGISLTSIKDIDDLTRRMEAGACDDILGGINKDERNAIMDAIMALCGKFLDTTSDNEYSPKADYSFGKEHLANVYISFIPNPDMPIVQLVFIPKSVSYAGAAGASSVVPKKGREIFCPLEYDNVCDGVDFTILKKFIEDVNTHFENTLYGYFIGKRVAFLVMNYYVHDNWGKYGPTQVMIKLKGFFFFKFESRKWLEDVLENGPLMIRNSPLIRKKWMMNTRLFKEVLTLILAFARCLIEVRADGPLKDSVTMAIPLSDGKGFTKETVQVEYSNVDKMNNGGFQMVVNKRKSGKTCSTIYNRSGTIAGKATWQPIKQKVSYEPKAHGNFPKNGALKISNFVKDYPFKKMLATRGGRHVPTSKPSVHTSNPYDVLDDMESEKEAEIVYDKTVILKDARTGSSPSTAPVYDSDGSAEVHENYDNNEIFNMFTQEEQYTELLEPIPKPQQVPQNDNNVISDVTDVEQAGETVEQNSANFEETRTLYDSLYQNLAVEVEKVNSVNRK